MRDRQGRFTRPAEARAIDAMNNKHASLSARLGLIPADSPAVEATAPGDSPQAPGLDGGFMTTAPMGRAHAEKVRQDRAQQAGRHLADDRADGTPTAQALQNFLGALRQQ